MGKQQLTWVFLLWLLVVTGCSEPPVLILSLEDVAVNLPDTELNGEEVAEAIQYVDQRIEDEVADMPLNMISFKGDCEALPRLRGSIGLLYVKPKLSIFREHLATSALAGIDTIPGTMDLRILNNDEVIAHPIEFESDITGRLFHRIEEEIESLGVQDCEFRMSSGSGALLGKWEIECTSGTCSHEMSHIWVLPHFW